MSLWWAISAGLGVVAGLWLRVPALLALTILVVIIAIVASLASTEPLETTLVQALVAVVLLQLGYIVGLFIATGWRHRPR